MVAVVEYAKHGNLRDYLRNIRTKHFLTNFQRNTNIKNNISNLLSLISSSSSSHDKEDETIGFRDLVSFAHQISIGMDFLHTKKVTFDFLIDYTC